MNPCHRWWAVVSALTSLCVGSPLWAYSWQMDPPVSWNVDGPQDPVGWVLNNEGCPGLSLGQTATVLEMSFQTWEDVECATIAFRYDGPTESAAADQDGLNVMVWRRDNWRYGSGALGVTGTWAAGGLILDADIEFNAVHYEWSTDGAAGTKDLQSIATHEIGHLLGLGHSTEPEATMYPYYSGGTAGRQLSDDDRTGVCVLYPAGAKGCTTSAECPPNTRCVDGRCQEGYDGAVCSPCTDHEQCGGAEDLCLRYPDGTARCARACTADGDCEAVPGCAERSCRCHDLGGDQGAQCVADDMTCIGGATCDTDDDCPNDQQCDGGNCIPKGCAALADQCDSADDCCSGLCVEGQCTQPCDWLTPNLGCPASFYCDIRECGTALCMPGKLGPAAAGESCLRHAECSTGYCASTGGPSTCQWPCEPEGRSACPESWSCLQIGASECGLCACHMGRLGDPCDGDNSCASGFCAGKSGQRRCTRGCHETNPCPEGYDCLDAGDSSICWPRQGGFDAACLNDNDCPAGSCRDGACTRVCQSDCDCPADYECPDDEGHCQRPPATGGCACQSTGPAPLAPTGAFLLLGAWLLWRSRRTGVEPRPGAR